MHCLKRKVIFFALLIFFISLLLNSMVLTKRIFFKIQRYVSNEIMKFIPQ